MWINFKCRYPFAVKVFVGGVNAVSGMSTRQPARSVKSQPVQDYVVPPVQLWLDGVAIADGKVRQFVATPVGSVEAQVTGAEDVADIQFEITPKHLDSYTPSKNKSKLSSIFIKSLNGNVFRLHVGPCYTISHVKDLIPDREGIAPDQQRLLHAERLLKNLGLFYKTNAIMFAENPNSCADETLSESGISDVSSAQHPPYILSYCVALFDFNSVRYSEHYSRALARQSLRLQNPSSRS
jgi:hypothetical protein